VNIIRVFENSALSVDKLTKDRMSSGDEVSDTQLDLKAGQIFGNVKKLSKDSKYEVKIPNGVAGIRGTTYLIGDGKIFVLTGSVVVAVVHPDGTVTTTTVHAGESFDIDTGKIEPLTKRERQRLEELSRILPQGPNNPGYIPGQPIIFVTPYGGKHP